MIRPDKMYTALEAEVLDLALVLHAEHGGGNNSSFATHVVSSSGTDTYSAIAAAVGSLKGPKHGGANVKVKMMMDCVRDNCKDPLNDKEVGAALQKIVRGQLFDGSGLIYGMGHPVYTLSDPRAVLLKAKASELAGEKGRTDDFAFYELVESLAPAVVAEEKGVKRPLPANVDFYSGLVYDMLGIPVELYTPIFAVARIAGWAAHCIEQEVSGGKIIRPAYRNVSELYSYTPLKSRH
jgi:citrate synthase